MDNIKLETAKAAIDEVFSDPSVSLEEGLSNLQSLRDEIDICIDAIEGDIRRAAE